MPTAEPTEWVTTTALGGIAAVLGIGAVAVLVCRWVRQPPVVGEIVAGICLGPSLLGLLPHDLPGLLFPPEVRPHLQVVAQVGLLLFMFLLGWEFDSTAVRAQRRTVGTLWITAFALPMVLGVALAAFLYRSPGSVGNDSIGFAEFALFMGSALAVSAFPVLARIITDLGLKSTRTGRLALTLAALDDVLAWCLLALVAALVKASGPADFLSVVGGGAAYVAAMLWAVRPALARLARRAGTGTPHLAMIAAAGALGSAYLTASIGLHAIFGAFFFGLAMPRGARHELLQKGTRAPLEGLGRLLLPVFFVVTGLSMDLTLLGTAGAVHLALILAAACVGKIGGILIAARLTGMNRHQGLALGVLMNTRGLTQLVILNAGLELGLLSTQLFTAMVVMAVLTTVMTSPLLGIVFRRASQDSGLGRETSAASQEPSASAQAS